MKRKIFCFLFILNLFQVSIVGTTVSDKYYDNVNIKQLTFTPKNHELDSNDNFSFDDRFICYDTRATLGSGIENCVSIEIVDIITGKEFVIYSPSKIRLGSKPAPGVGAVSFHPEKYRLVFIHGPLTNDIAFEEVNVKNIYAKNNRRGKIIDFEYMDGKIITRDGGWIDSRNIDCESGLQPGVHRGGSHRHEYALNGVRIGCTYDDFLLPDYGRTIAFFEPMANLPFDANYYFSVILRPVPIEKAKFGDIVRAYGDSWVDKNGRLRGFIGTVKLTYGFDEHLFVAEIPEDLDITTASSGDCKNYPAPPDRIKLTKIYDKWCSGVVRGSPDGNKIAFLAKDSEGKTQIFIADLNNMSKDNDKCKIIQITNFQEGVEDNFRWHPSGKYIFSVSGGAIMITFVEEGPNFGKSKKLTPSYMKNKPYAIAVSRSGNYLAFNRRVPTYDLNGNRVFDSLGLDFSQIFLLVLPENLF